MVSEERKLCEFVQAMIDGDRDTADSWYCTMDADTQDLADFAVEVRDALRRRLKSTGEGGAE
jgi:hypothetical protein